MHHIALSIPFDLEGINREASAGHCPRHTMWDLAQTVEATVHQPDAYPITFQDKLAAKLISQPEHWAMARALTKQLDQNDVVFCAGEDTGTPLALLCRGLPNRPNLVVTVMAPERLRFRSLAKFFNLANVIDLFVTNTAIKATFIRDYLKVDPNKIYVVPEQTDVRFFTPGAVSIEKTRPLVASAGREQRDYKTLALATQDLDVDVDICAISPNASSSTRVAFPEEIPANMSFNPHDWPEFRQLYRNSDVVVISLFDNHYSAGLTVLMEAMACRRPIIMTDTPGLARQLINQGVVLGVKPGDADAMRQSIVRLLENPDQAKTLAEKGYQRLLKHHTSENYVACLAQEMQKLHVQQHRRLKSTRVAEPMAVSSR
ncbi:MAG: glycosyltransferase family 4 protein [Leptolyngbyaceae cyanobacterium]